MEAPARPHRPQPRLWLIVFLVLSSQQIDTLPAAPVLSDAARQYLALLENFGRFAETHWNEKEESYDAKGSGVTWARGNGGVCLVNAVLLTEFPDRSEFFPQRITRAALLDHTRRAIRQLCLTSRVCTDPRAI